MELKKFEDKLQAIRAANGWRLEIEIPGIYIIRVYDKESLEFLAETGCTSLEGILIVLQDGLDSKVWTKKQPHIIQKANDAYEVFKALNPSIEPNMSVHGVKTVIALKSARRWVVANPNKCHIFPKELLEAITKKIEDVYDACGVKFSGIED